MIFVKVTNPGKRAGLVQIYEFVPVTNPGKRAGVVQFYEFVTGTNPGSEAGFVTIYEPRFELWLVLRRLATITKLEN